MVKDIKDRLCRLTGDDPPAGKSTPRDREIGGLRRRIEEIMSRRPGRGGPFRTSPADTAVDLQTLIQGEEVRNDEGTFFVSEIIIEGSRFHGSRTIREFSPINMKIAAILAGNPHLENLDGRDGLFLDVETTGLAGGTGTMAFLIGLGWTEGDRFAIRQIFVRDFTEERAALVYLSELARNRKFLVSFNGKTFDVGLLSTRFIMNRLVDVLADMPHLDLLYPCRRLFRHRLENTRLATLEEALIGLQREGDIAGSEIPQRYFTWLQRRDAHLMGDVFRHNRLDVITLAALTSHLANMFGFHPSASEHHPRDLHAAACLCLARGKIEEARRLLETLIHSDNRDVSLDSRRTLSLTYKRHGLWSEATNIWEALVAEDPGNFFAVEELAKWCEHRTRDHRHAIDLVRRALGQTRGITHLQREALLHRFRRLEEKLLRTGGN